jgi:hypothetical protein
MSQYFGGAGSPGYTHPNYQGETAMLGIEPKATPAGGGGSPMMGGDSERRRARPADLSDLFRLAPAKPAAIDFSALIKLISQMQGGGSAGSQLTRPPMRF